MVHASNGETAIARCVKDAEGYRLGIPRSQRTANARLIAAAPSLLDALKFALEVVKAQGPVLHHNVINQMEASIAKAEGRSWFPESIGVWHEVFNDSADFLNCPLGKAHRARRHP